MAYPSRDPATLPGPGRYWNTCPKRGTKVVTYNSGLGHLGADFDYDLPLITIDNQHMLRYISYDCPSALKNDRQLTVHIIRAMVPKADVSLVTIFYSGEAKNQRTFLFPSLLRSKALAIVGFVNSCLPRRDGAFTKILAEKVGPERVARQGWIFDLVFTVLCGNDGFEYCFHKLKSILHQLNFRISSKN